MFVPADNDFSAAVEKFEDAGFRRTPWSYATRDPDLLGTNPLTLKIHARRIREYERFDQHSVRFHFPSSFNIREKVVLLRSSYVHLSPPSDDAEIATATHQRTQQFFIHGNLYYPDKVMLLESFIRVALKEEKEGEGLYNWSELLGAWAISYICGMLNVDVDALDACEDEAVKDWYNKNIRREQGGLDRTINKWMGRKERVPGDR